MIKIGITGQLSSGKSLFTKLICRNKYKYFSADKEVNRLYADKKFLKILKKKLGLRKNNQLKKEVKILLRNKKNYIRKLESLIHPLVRKQMLAFTKINKSQKLLFYEIPLLFENKLQKKFDTIILVRANKKIRLHRYKRRGGLKYLFNYLDKRQLNIGSKISQSDYIIVNNSTKRILNNKARYILRKYE